MTQSDNISRALGVIEGKVDSLIDDVKSIRSTSDTKHEALRTRVNTLEKKQYTILVMGGFIGSAILAFIKKVGAYMHF